MKPIHLMVFLFAVLVGCKKESSNPRLVALNDTSIALFEMNEELHLINLKLDSIEHLTSSLTDRILCLTKHVNSGIQNFSSCADGKYRTLFEQDLVDASTLIRKIHRSYSVTLEGLRFKLDAFGTSKNFDRYFEEEYTDLLLQGLEDKIAEIAIRIESSLRWSFQMEKYLEKTYVHKTYERSLEMIRIDLNNLSEFLSKQVLCFRQRVNSKTHLATRSINEK